MADLSLVRFFADIPGAQHYLMIKPSSACAANRLLQLREMGVLTCSLDDQIQRLADQLDKGPRTTEYFEAAVWQYCVQAVQAEYKQLPKESQERAEKEFHCILRGWQIVDGVGSLARSSLVFSDRTTTRYLVIETALKLDRHLLTLARKRGQRLYCLARYLGYEPESVRCATFTLDNPVLPEGLLSSEASSPAEGTEAAFVQIDASNFVPNLSRVVLDAVDHVVLRDLREAKRIELLRQAGGSTKEELWEEVFKPSGRHQGNPEDRHKVLITDSSIEEV